MLLISMYSVRVFNVSLQIVRKDKGWIFRFLRYNLQLQKGKTKLSCRGLIRSEYVTRFTINLYGRL